MSKKISFFLICMLLFCGHTSSAQSDTFKLSLTDFINIVKNYHPFVKKYYLQNDIAQYEIQKARGNFDPVLDAKTGEKTIDMVNYYRASNIALDIPTWYGIEFNGSYNHIEGAKLDNSTTEGGLYQFGITVPLAKNLIYDKRRAVLDQAKAAEQMTQAEQQLLLNELLLKAENIYWTWVRDYEVYQLQRRTININKERLEWIRKAYQYGERPAIDTTEALTQLLSFEQQQQDALLKFIKSTQELQLFLWKEDSKPYELTAWLLPQDELINTNAYKAYPNLIASAESRLLSGHASIIYYSEKQNLLDSERRLKRQSLLPKIDFTYNFLNKYQYNPQFFPLFENNFQYGLKLEMPLFLRSARADYKIAQAKLKQNKIDTDYKLMEINNKINKYKNEILNYSLQINLADQNIANYSKLFKAEEIRYSNGESSLFLINSREIKLLEAEQKLIELRLKFICSYNELKWLNENFMIPAR